jgi:hypothetical protein
MQSIPLLQIKNPHCLRVAGDLYQPTMKNPDGRINRRFIGEATTFHCVS